MILSNCPVSMKHWITFGEAEARRYTESASCASTILMRSPSSSVHSSLSSPIHFCSSCCFPCWITGFASSIDSIALSLPFSSSMPKYVRIGVACPGCPGACWNRWIVAGVRSTCCGDSAASLAAPLKSIEFIRFSNCWVNSCSAPGRLFFTARRIASGKLFSCLHT